MSNIEPKEGDFYTSHNNFVEAIKEYAKKKGFQVRLGKVEKNAVGIIRKRTILCNREGDPEKTSISANIRNRASQRCNCKFLVRASFNTENGLWYIIVAHLEHNHAMVTENHKHFMSNERSIPLEVQERILLLHRAGCNPSVIHSIGGNSYGIRYGHSWR